MKRLIAILLWGLVFTALSMAQMNLTQTGQAIEAIESDELEAGHPSLPIHTRLQVTNLANRKTISVLVTTRIPSRQDRILELSRKAAHELGMSPGGVINVSYTITGNEGLEIAAKRTYGDSAHETPPPPASNALLNDGLGGYRSESTAPAEPVETVESSGPEALEEDPYQSAGDEDVENAESLDWDVPAEPEIIPSASLPEPSPSPAPPPDDYWNFPELSGPAPQGNALEEVYTAQPLPEAATRIEILPPPPVSPNPVSPPPSQNPSAQTSSINIQPAPNMNINIYNRILMPRQKTEPGADPAPARIDPLPPEYPEISPVKPAAEKTDSPAYPPAQSVRSDPPREAYPAAPQPYPPQAMAYPPGAYPPPAYNGPPASVPPAPVYPGPPPPLYPAPDQPPAYTPPVPPFPPGFFRIQVGSYSNADNARSVFNHLSAAGFSPSYERYGSFYRVVIPGIPEREIPDISRRLGAAGFQDIWVRPES
jgi:hypothetical protein